MFWIGGRLWYMAVHGGSTVINYNKHCFINCYFIVYSKYSKASTVLSVAGIRQQFSVVENIQMSRSSFQFLTDIGQSLAVEGCDPPDVQLQRLGYMFLASKESEETMRDNYALQRYGGIR